MATWRPPRVELATLLDDSQKIITRLELATELDSGQGVAALGKGAKLTQCGGVVAALKSLSSGVMVLRRQRRGECQGEGEGERCGPNDVVHNLIDAPVAVILPPNREAFPLLGINIEGVDRQIEMHRRGN